MFREFRSIAAVVFFLAVSAFAQTGSGIIKGKVADTSGAVIPGAKVTVTGPTGAVKTATAGADGSYSISGLGSGIWSVQAAAPGLKQVNAVAVDLSTANVQTANLTLDVVLANQEVTVHENAAPEVTTSPENNAGSVVLKKEDLEALSDDPDELQDDLTALAGPSAGPDGGQIYIDGFTGGTLPPKSAIREIRINQNPFSAEYNQLGYGRIEILTKPGTDNWHGTAYLNDSEGAFSARNPFATSKPDFDSRQFGGDLSGSLGKKTSLFFDFQRRQIDDTAVVNAITLNSQLIPAPFNQNFATPQRRTSVSPRIDYQLTPDNTLMVRYRYSENDRYGYGVNGTSLPSQAYTNFEKEQTVQVTDTIVVNPKTINETRFQFYHTTTASNPAETTPMVNVQGSFSDGGATVGLSNDDENYYELQNYTTYASGAHSLKYGIRMRGITDDNISQSNYNGTWLFNSLAAYQQMLQLENQGLTSLEIYNSCTDPTRGSCPGPSQYSITHGTPEASVGYVEAGLFLQDDWRLKPNFTLSLGLRYEVQNNISDKKDFAPRLGFAWAPGQHHGGPAPKTVFRGGWGMFYSRFGETYTLAAERYNGITQQQYLVKYPSCYPNFVAGVTENSCPLGTVAGQNITTIDKDLRTPYIMQTAVGIERQLPGHTRLSVNYLDSRGVHMLLMRDINAPLPGTFVAENPVYPYLSVNGTGQIDQYESGGFYRQKQIMVSANSRMNRNISFFGNYTYNIAHSTTDGASLVSDPYDISADYGDSSLDVHNRVFFGGSIVWRWALRLSPFMIYQSSRPYNIVIPQDLIGDGVKNQRPAYATASTPGAVDTPYGWLNPNPGVDEARIPRNLGEGPGFFSLNVRLSKTFGFGPETNSSTGGRGSGGGRHGGGGLFGGGGGGMFGGADTGRRYNLTLGVQARNLFNTVNPGPPGSVLGTPLFGLYNGLAQNWGTTSATNRRVEIQLRFSF